MNFEKKIFDIDAIFNTGIFFCNYGGFYEFSVGLGGAHSNSHFDGYLMKNGQTQFHGAVLVMSNSDLNFNQLWLYWDWKFVNFILNFQAVCWLIFQTLRFWSAFYNRSFGTETRWHCCCRKKLWWNLQIASKKLLYRISTSFSITWMFELK